MNDPVAAALDDLVPSFAAEQPDWPAVVARAKQRQVPVPTWRRRPRLLAAALLLLMVVALLATPAFGIQGFVLDLFGRKNVSFANSSSAPNEIKKRFEDLAIGPPGPWAPEVIAAQARLVGTFSIGGHPRKLWVAPTRRGGYCYMFEKDFGGCRTTTSRRDIGRKGQFSVTWQSSHDDETLVTRVGGDIDAPAAATITARYADGETRSIPFVWVSSPINAGFFTYTIPVAHRNKPHRLVSLTLTDRAGHVLARQSFPSHLPAVSHPPMPLPPSMLTGPKQRILPTKPPTPPSAPRQTGAADGFAVIAGHNGSVQFTETAATPSLKRLVGQSASFDCFRLTREFGIFTVRDSGDEGRFARSVGTQLKRVGTPFDGCEIEAPFGHTWPDRFASHSIVEIAFTQAGRRFFADRAAARDLALFTRSAKMHQLRKQPAPEAIRAIETTYKQQLAHSRIRVQLVDPTTFRISETSTTGRTFHVTIHNGHIKNENLNPYAFVF